MLPNANQVGTGPWISFFLWERPLLQNCLEVFSKHIPCYIMLPDIFDLKAQLTFFPITLWYQPALVPAAQNMPSACYTIDQRLDICGKTLFRDLAFEDNFVTVGGNSLIAICLVNAIKNISFDIGLREALLASDNHRHCAVDCCLRYFLNCKRAAL